jgi:hypothetical protein
MFQSPSRAWVSGAWVTLIARVRQAPEDHRAALQSALAEPRFARRDAFVSILKLAVMRRDGPPRQPAWRAHQRAADHLPVEAPPAARRAQEVARHGRRACAAPFVVAGRRLIHLARSFSRGDQPRRSFV